MLVPIIGVDALATVNPKNKPLSRRAALLNTSFALASVPTIANAVTVLNDDGEYVQVTEQDWQTTWKSRLDKASTMSTDQVFMAARGAGNVDPDNSKIKVRQPKSDEPWPGAEMLL